MKKIIGVVIALISILIFASMNIIKAIGIIEEGGFALVDNTIVDKLTSDEIADEDTFIETFEVRYGDNIYQKNGEILIGENQKRINKNFPIFTKDTKSINIINREGSLITDTFINSDTFPNIIISDGNLYQSGTRERLDNNKYILYKANNDIYVGLSNIKVRTFVNEYNIPMNSILKFNENSIKIYSFIEDTLSYRALKDVDKNTVLYIDDKLFKYEDFLNKLKRIGKEEGEDTKKLENENNKDKSSYEDKKSNIIEESTGENGTGTNIIDDITDNRDNDNNNINSEYIEPKVILLELNAGVYRIEPKIEIEDPASRITYPIEVRIFQGNKLILKKEIESKELSAIEGLKPNTDYSMVLSFSFINESGEKSKKEVASESFKTKDILELKAMNISFNEGNLFSDSIELKNFKVTFSDEESRKNTTVIQIKFNDKIVNIPQDDVELLKKNQEVTVTAKNIFDSNKNYNFEVIPLDKYGNKLPIINATGMVRTSMIAPKGKITIEKQNVLSYTLKYKEENKDNVEIFNKRFVVYDINNKEIIQGKLSEDNIIEIDSLETETIYFVRVIGDYDLNNNSGLNKDLTISELRLTTVPLSALGSISINNEFIDVKKDSFLLNFKLNRDSTKDILVKLLDKFVVNIFDENNNSIFYRELDDEELNNFKNNNEISCLINNLSSKSSYNLKIETYSVDSFGSEKEIKNLLYNSSVRTLKRPVDVYITNIYVTENNMICDAYINDIDTVVNDNKVQVEVREKSTSKLIYSEVLDTNQYYKEISISNLTAGESYSLKVIAEQYNEGYNNETLLYKHVIKEATVIAENTVESSLNLKKLEDNKDGTFTAKINTYITNWYKLFPNNEFKLSYYKDGILEKTLTYEVDMSQMVFKRQLDFIIEKGHEYEFKIHAEIYGKDTVFTSIRFRTDKELIGIYSQDDFKEIEKDLSADYLVLNDLDLTKENIKIQGDFTGEINFNGYSVKLEVTEENNALFRNIAEEGRIKNLVLNLLSYKSDYSGKYGLAENNYGNISNIYVNFDGNGYGINDNTSLISKNNFGVIEKFVINIKKSVYVADKMGLVAINNYGTVKDGYIYGQKIAASAGNAVGRIVAGAVAINNENGIVEFVQSHVTISGPTINQSENVASVVGKNEGTVRSLYSVGVGANLVNGYGPTVGTSVGSSNNIYYYAEDINLNTNNNVNERIRASRLATIKFIKSIFNVESYELLEEAMVYYPKLKLDKSMPEQPNIQLEKDSSLNEVSIVDKNIENITDNSATINLTINNPFKVSFIEVKIPNLHTRIVNTSIIGDTTEVTIEVTAERYFSNYYISDISYMDTGSSGKLTYLPNEEVINVSFYKAIMDIKDWQSIDKDSGENYTLKNSIDLSTISSISLVNNIKVGDFRGNGNKIYGINLRYTAANRGLFNEVSGVFSDVYFENISITSNNNGTGIFISNKGILENITFNNIDIKIEGTNRLNAGPIVNNEGIVRNIVASEVRVKGNSYISGLVVNNVKNNSIINNVLLTSIIIEGENTTGSKKHHAGAVAYVSDGIVQNIIVKDSKITAGTKSGIAIAEAAKGVIRDVYVVDSEISTINLNGLNQVGGIIGILLDDVSVTNAGIVNSRVSAKEYVGGAFSNAGGATFNNIFVINVDVNSVSGHRAAGIIATTGGNKYFSLNNAYSFNVNVKGNDFVGGVIGYMNNGDISNVYTNSNVVGNAKVGGVAGSIDSGRDMRLENIMSFSNVTGSDAKTTSYGGGAVQFEKNNIKNLYIWENSKVNNVTFKDSAPLKYAANGFKAVDLLDNKFYLDKLGFSSENWKIDASVSGIMPKIIYENVVLKYQLDIQIPGISTYSLIDGSNKIIEIPEVNIYPVGVDTVNLEFTDIYEELEFEVSSNDVVMVRRPLDKYIYTLQYDYNSLLRIDIKHDDEIIKSYSISPLDVNRKVSTENNKYYYIASNGVETNNGFIEGDFVNINSKKGLRRDGSVIDLESRDILRSDISGVKLLDETKSIFNFKYRGVNIDIFKDYSLIDGISKEVLLYIKNNNLYSLDSKFSFVRDSIIVDTIEGKEYETVLGNNGILYDLKTKINYPSDFINKGIKYISNNINDDSKNIIVYYEDNSILGFNYKTGKLIFDKKSEEFVNNVSNLSFVDYIKEKASRVFRVVDNIFVNDFNSEELNFSERYKEALEEKEVINDLIKLEEGQKGEVQKNDLITMYNRENNRYEVYNIQDMLSKEKVEVISENIKIENEIGRSELELRLLEHKKSSKAIKTNSNSILLFGVIVALIYGTMAYVFKNYIAK